MYNADDLYYNYFITYPLKSMCYVLFTDLFEELKKQRESCLIDNSKLFIEEKIAKG